MKWAIQVTPPAISNCQISVDPPDVGATSRMMGLMLFRMLRYAEPWTSGALTFLTGSYSQARDGYRTVMAHDQFLARLFQ